MWRYCAARVKCLLEPARVRFGEVGRITKVAMAQDAKKLCTGVQGNAGTDGPTGKDDRLIWVDLEMTGLDVDKDRIIEMACLITDGQLNPVAEGPNLIIHTEDKILDGMGPWCTKQHGESGLTQAVRNSKISITDAEKEMLDFVRWHANKKVGLLAGNSIHEDRRFLMKYMPDFMDHLHHRIIDVSTVKELCRRWCPEEFKHTPHKACTHRALDDIKKSIKELQYYQKTIFKTST